MIILLSSDLSNLESNVFVDAKLVQSLAILKEKTFIKPTVGKFSNCPFKNKNYIYIQHNNYVIE